MFDFSKKVATLVAATATLAVVGCGGGGEANVDPETWPETWCQVKIGDTPERAIELMGEPTRDARLMQSASMRWEWQEYQFTAFLDVDDRLGQLEIDGADLTMHQKRMFECAMTRSTSFPNGEPSDIDTDALPSGTAP